VSPEGSQENKEKDMARYQPQNPWLWANDTQQRECDEKLPLDEQIRCTERSLKIVREDYAAILELYTNLHGEDLTVDGPNRRGLQISIVRCEMRIEQLRTTLETLRTKLRNVS
jgi:hypothetical protein